jgi:hypothetical protein
LNVQPLLLIARLLLMVLVPVRPAFSALACRNLPESTLRLHSAQPIETEEQSATLSEMDRIALEIGVSAAAQAAHPLMLIINELGTQVSVRHRTIGTRGDGELAYCDAPKSVEFALGLVGREVFLEEHAAADPCVRNVLLEHDAEHHRALRKAIEVFVERRREELLARLQELKRTPAPDRASAINTLESGLKSFIVTMVKEFKDDMERSREDVDTPRRLQELRNACGGKVRELEQQLTTRTPGRPT